MKKRILNIGDVPVMHWAHGDTYEAEIAWAGHEIGSEKLGFNIAVVPPGKRVFPFHAHRANEEMFFVLEGEGSIRIGETTHRIRRGDFVSLPPGPDSAHQIVNDSSAPLRYLAVSTMEHPEVAEYPESGKLGIFAGHAPGHAPTEDSISHFTWVRDGIPYWEGE